MNASSTTHRNPITRRKWGQWALAATAGFGLAACGGGGGGSDEPPTLREAFDRLQPGMTKKQVRELIGREPSSISNTSYGYRAGTENLSVTFSPDSSKAPDDYVLSGANWYEIGGQDIVRGYL